jgi:hypothetical protein
MISIEASELRAIATLPPKPPPHSTIVLTAFKPDDWPNYLLLIPEQSA